MPNVTDIIEKALALPIVDRSYVASKLLESLEREEFGMEEIAAYDQRVARWKAGETPASTCEELDSKVQTILQT